MDPIRYKILDIRGGPGVVSSCSLPRCSVGRRRPLICQGNQKEVKGRGYAVAGCRVFWVLEVGSWKLERLEDAEDEIGAGP